MIKYFRKITSLNNLDSQARSGQVATMLTLIMVAILVLILITVNIGDVSMKTTTIANAADTGALQLGSQLSTMANSYYEALGNSCEMCQDTGVCSIFIGGLTALAAVLITILTAGASSPLTGPLALTAIGAIAGGIGAGISAWARTGTLGGSFWWSQFMMGVSIGAAIGSCGSMIAGAPETAVAAGEEAAVSVPESSSATIAASGGDITIKASAAGTAASPTVVINGTTGTMTTLTAGQSMILPAGQSATIMSGAATVTPLGTASATITTAGTATAAVAPTAGTAMPALAPSAGTSATVAAPSIWATIGNGLVSAYNFANSAISFLLEWTVGLPGKALNLMGITSSTLGLDTVLLTAPTKAITIGDALNLALTSAAAVYGATPVVSTRINQAMGQYSRLLNSLGDTESVRQGTILSAISQVVDDPHETSADFSYDCNGDGTKETGGDPCDSDADGDTQEKISYFQFWWDRHLRAIKDATDKAYDFVNGFCSSDLTNFKSYLKTDVLKGDSSPDYLARLETDGVDGEVVGFVRSLNNAGIDVPFWRPGPTAEQFQNWQNECPDLGGCPKDYLKDNGYDEVDANAYKFEKFVKMVDELQAEGLGETWQYWWDWLYQDPSEPGYDAEKDGSYYKVFDRMLYGSDEPGKEFKGLYDWKEDIENIEVKLGECVIDANTGSIINAPCKHTYSEAEPYYYSTTDADTNDEFNTAKTQIQDIIDQVLSFNNSLFNVNDKIKKASIGTIDVGGTNPVTYNWEDSRGTHKVIVQTSNFTVPNTIEEERGDWWSGEDCTVLKDYTDNGQKTWVKVIREDPDEKKVGILGFWRPSKIERTAHAAYSYDYVNLVAGN